MIADQRKVLKDMSELSAESANFAWLPILLAVAICLFFAGSVAAVWLINRGSTKQKVFRTISIVIWAIVFCGLEGALAWFASVDAAGESRTRFVLCCCCIGAGGALCACAKSKFEVFTEQNLDQLTGQRVDCETDQGDGQAAAQSVNLSFRPHNSITKNPNKLQSILRIIHTSLLWAVS